MTTKVLYKQDNISVYETDGLIGVSYSFIGKTEEDILSIVHDAKAKNEYPWNTLNELEQVREFFVEGLEEQEKICITLFRKK